MYLSTRVIWSIYLESEHCPQASRLQPDLPEGRASHPANHSSSAAPETRAIPKKIVLSTTRSHEVQQIAGCSTHMKLIWTEGAGFQLTGSKQNLQYMYVECHVKVGPKTQELFLFCFF